MKYENPELVDLTGEDAAGDCVGDGSGDATCNGNGNGAHTGNCSDTGIEALNCGAGSAELT